MSSFPQNQDVQSDGSESHRTAENSDRYVATVLVAATSATVVLLGIAWFPKTPDNAVAPSPEAVAAGLSTSELARVRRTSVVCRELLRRPDVDLKTLNAALIRLAHLQKKTQPDALQEFVLAADSAASVESLRNVSRLCHGNEDLRSTADSLVSRNVASLPYRVGLAMQISLAGNTDDLFAEAANSPTAQASLLKSLPLIHSEEVRSKLYHHIRPILFAESAGDGADVQEMEELQELAISVMMQLPGREIQKARDLVRLISEERCEISAIAAFATLPIDCWPQGDLGKLAEAVIAAIADSPVDHRDSADIQAAFRLGHALLEYFPDTERDRLQERLAELAAESDSQ